MGGVKAYRGHPNIGAPKHTGASKHMGVSNIHGGKWGNPKIQGLSQHTGGILNI